MARHLRLFATVILCGQAACFRELDSVQPGAPLPPALVLEVRDQQDGLWGAEDAPRMPVFSLRGQDGAASGLAERLFLLRGAPSAAQLEDLRGGSLRAATERARVELRVAPCRSPASESAAARVVSEERCALPRAQLEPGAHYALVWADKAGVVPFPITVSESPAAGARLVATLPGELSARVPTNLTRVLLRFDGYLAPLDGALSLRDAQGRAVAARTEVRPCAELGLPAGDCIEIFPDGPLVEATRHTLLFEGSLRDATGAVLPAPKLGFTTAQSDLRPPLLRATDCARDERALQSLCILASERSVSVRARSDESGELTLSAEGALTTAIGATADYELVLALAGERIFTLALRDLAGNTSHSQVTLAPAAQLAPISIDEVRVDSLGPEPAQEYVELLNFGAGDVSIMGFSLTQDAFAQGQVITEELTLAAGERALIVAPDFDPHEPSDGLPPAGVRLVRLARPLSLRNEGAALYLRDAQGRRLSAAPALPPEQPGQCIHRTGDERRDGQARLFARDAQGGCTPGSASGP